MTTLISPTTPPHTALSGLVANGDTVALVVANMPTQAIFTLAKALYSRAANHEHWDRRCSERRRHRQRVSLRWGLGSQCRHCADDAAVRNDDHHHMGLEQYGWAYYFPRGPLLADNGWLYFRYGGGIFKPMPARP